MTLRDVVRLSCTNCKVFVGDKLAYSTFTRGLDPLLDRRVLWIDAEDDILLIGIEEVTKMKKNRISVEEHNDNFMLIVSGIMMGMIMLSLAYLFVSLIK